MGSHKRVIAALLAVVALFLSVGKGEGYPPTPFQHVAKDAFRPVYVVSYSINRLADTLDPTPNPTPVMPTKEDARAYALSKVGAVQFVCLDKLWTRESHWNWYSKNKTSGAYGIPQAYPAEKMASAGSDWLTNPITQVKWGLGYIHGRYGTPCDAWDFSLAHGWY